MRFKGRSIEKNEYKCSFMNEECGDKYQGETEREEINLQNEKKGGFSFPKFISPYIDIFCNIITGFY